MTVKKCPKTVRKQIRLDRATADLLALLAAALHKGNESAAIRRSIRLAAAKIRRLAPPRP